MAIETFQLSAELERMATLVSLPAGSVLFRCGDPVSAVFLIRSGSVSMFLDSKNRSCLTRTLGPGEIAGLPAALTGIYSLSAQVAEDAELGFIPAPLVSALLERSPHLCLIAARAMSDEIARMRSGLRDSLPPD
ncbi:MAG TPA: Crp/Fnr family transcriptional regulator [Acidobacteriaceae bacterium]|jgi:CRP-like cAMP-binding protein|nr:Crp/Fnr family transcriptional regulator [Acidobacteriaceae bacterium]